MAAVPFATADTDNILETSVAGISDFSSLTVNYGTASSSVTAQKDSSTGAVTLSGTTFSSANMTITLALDYNALLEIVATTTGQKLVTASGVNNQSVSITLGVGVNSDAAIQGWWQSSLYASGPTTGALSGMSSYAEDGTLLVTFVSGTGAVESTSEDGTTTLKNGASIYVGNEAVLDGALAGLMGTATYSTMTIDGAYADAVKGVYVFNSVLSQSDVASVNSAIRSLSVPEPTSASLSLLAFGALALRRRR